MNFTALKFHSVSSQISKVKVSPCHRQQGFFVLFIRHSPKVSDSMSNISFTLLNQTGEKVFTNTQLSRVCAVNENQLIEFLETSKVPIPDSLKQKTDQKNNDDYSNIDDNNNNEGWMWSRYRFTLSAGANSPATVIRIAIPTSEIPVAISDPVVFRSVSLPVDQYTTCQTGQFNPGAVRAIFATQTNVLALRRALVSMASLVKNMKVDTITTQNMMRFLLHSFSQALHRLKKTKARRVALRNSQ